jgi:hypothetical protein
VREYTDWRTNINTKFLERFLQAHSKVAGVKMDQYSFDMKKFSSSKSTASQFPMAIDDKKKISKIINKKFSESTTIPTAL